MLTTSVLPVSSNISDQVYSSVVVQCNTIQILLSTPHGGFSETSINSTGNQKKKKRKKKVSQIDYQ